MQESFLFHFIHNLSWSALLSSSALSNVKRQIIIKYLGQAFSRWLNITWHLMRFFSSQNYAQNIVFLFRVTFVLVFFSCRWRWELWRGRRGGGWWWVGRLTWSWGQDHETCFPVIVCSAVIFSWRVLKFILAALTPFLPSNLDLTVLIFYGETKY